MNRTLRYGVGLLVLALAWAAPAPTPAESPAADPGDVGAIVAGNNAFAVDLYARLAAVEPGNLFFSPFSVSSAVAMTWAGARGATEAQTAQALHFGLTQARLHPAFAALNGDLNAAGAAGAFQLTVANSLWRHASYKFLPAFLDLAQAHYGAGVQVVDFAGGDAARQAINDWVDKETRQKIKDLIPPGVLTPLTRMVLANAIYFKGTWATQFKPADTTPAPFFLAAGAPVDAPLMHQKRGFQHLQGAGVHILEMPYVGDRLSLVAVLPDARDGLAALEKGLTAEQLAGWTAGLAPAEKVDVFFPRFKTTFACRLDPALQAMGMRDAFDMGKADLSGMDGTHELYIQAALHKAFVEVNEEGTEAAAATAVVVGTKSMPPPIPVFRADHPFLFLIRDRKSGAILFLGRVMDPRG